jgi:hypothetical protein
MVRTFLSDLVAKYERVATLESPSLRLSSEDRPDRSARESLAYCAVRFVAKRGHATLGVVLVREADTTWKVRHLLVSE